MYQVSKTFDGVFGIHTESHTYKQTMLHNEI